MNLISKNNEHERAKRLIAAAGPEEFSTDQPADQSSANAWLAAHLGTCDSCRSFAENAAETIRKLRSVPIAAGRSLVSATQIRVRRRALELQQRREHLRMVSICCIAVTLCALLSTVVLWRGFEWLGARAQLASAVWQVAFLVFCVMPALVTALLLLAKENNLSRPTGLYRPNREQDSY